MAACDLCGKTGPLFLTTIEGCQMTVCGPCSSAGKVIREVRQALPGGKRKDANPLTASGGGKVTAAPVGRIIVGDFARRIHQAREKLGMQQKEFAARLNERESFVQHLENGKITPSLNVARKLERILSITLIEEAPSDMDRDQEEGAPHGKKRDDTLTLGDIIQVRKR